MGIAELINKEKKTAFSFEVLPPSGYGSGGCGYT